MLVRIFFSIWKMVVTVNVLQQKLYQLFITEGRTIFGVVDPKHFSRLLRGAKGHECIVSSLYVEWK